MQNQNKKWLWILGTAFLTIILVKAGKNIRGYFAIGGEVLVPGLIYILFLINQWRKKEFNSKY